jgi:hypothetical protein
VPGRWIDGKRKEKEGQNRVEKRMWEAKGEVRI